ncbi:MAG: response regulator [Vicinamibacterales bacterium]
MLPTVLIADESRGTRQLLTRHLRAMGWQTIEASDGLETLDRLTERDADFAIVDMSLRLLSTPEVVTVLRRSPKYRDLPVVAMGAATPRALEALIALGIDDFFVKPFSADFLMERLRRFAPKTNVRVRETKALGAGPPPADGVALVVDADAQFRDFAAKVLAARYRVVEAASGVAALRACGGQRPAVVLAGFDTGLLGPPMLAEHFAKRPDTAKTAVVLVRSPSEDLPPPGMFTAVVNKTFVIEDFERQFARAMGRSLVDGSPALMEVRQAVEAATQQALGMMAGCDVHVAGRESAADLSLWAWTDISIAEESVTVRMALRSDERGAMSIAAGLLGMSADDLAPEDGLAALGELVNVIAGRVKSTACRPGRTLTFDIPQLAGTDAPAPIGNAEVCLLFEPTDSRFRLGVEVGIAGDLRAVDPGKAA